ncbi:MAG: 50S ribosomal protein L30 [Chloroflexi bacterium]|nr:50S ribosomal protein L30 [Chloroflexota bacterium]
MAKLRIVWVKSIIGAKEPHRRTIRALGLRRLHQVVEHQDSSTIRGMVHQVRHLVEVEEIPEERARRPGRTGSRSVSQAATSRSDSDAGA